MNHLRSWLLCAAFFASGTFPAQSAPPPFSFLVPLSLSKLHDNLTLMRVRCWVLPTRDWTSRYGALGEGVSEPLDTHSAHALRGFEGDVPVFVPLSDARADPQSALSYRCQVELYDSAGRVWGDMTSIARRYPIDRSTLAIAETGGVLP